MIDADALPAPVPVVFGDCFGWYHSAPSGCARARSVVLCPPFGVEMLWTYRNLRSLAELLARAGLPVLRFDYPGTGDSPGGNEPCLLERWLAAIDAAVSLLRERSETEEVALCGLRLGGLLAAEAARRLPGPAGRLALLAPVISGAGYARELAIWGRMRPQQRTRADWVEVAGFALHASDIDRLHTLDLKAALAEAPPSALLVLDIAQDRLRDDAWSARLTTAGTALAIERFAGYPEFMREAYLATTPIAEFERVAAFLRDGAAPAFHGTISSKEPDACVVVRDGATIEAPVTFGRAQDLFGILCAPGAGAYDAETGAPAVVILNTGSNHRIGDARYAVLLARGLAAQGIVSLRVDLRGVGDSLRGEDPRLLGGGPDAYRRAHVRLYGRSHTADVRAALDALAARGYGPFILVGVCSGADAALNAALADPRVAGLALGNLPSFGRLSGGEGAAEAALTARVCGVPLPHRLARALLGWRARNWLTRTFRQAHMTFERLLGRTVAPIAGRVGVGRVASAMHVLRMLSRRKAEVLLLYSRDDPGFAGLEACFGPDARRLVGIPGVGCVVFDGNDHEFSASDLRDVLIGYIEQHVRTVLSAIVPDGRCRPEGLRADAPLRSERQPGHSRNTNAQRMLGPGGGPPADRDPPVDMPLSGASFSESETAARQ